MKKILLIGVLMLWPALAWPQSTVESLLNNPAGDLSGLVRGMRQDRQDRELREYQQEQIRLQAEQNQILRRNQQQLLDHDICNPYQGRRGRR
jgi:hypothetical protein